MRLGYTSMHPFVLGSLRVLIPGAFFLLAFVLTKGSHDGLIGVLCGGSSVFAVLLLNEIAKSR
jgi:hypothetical protein